METADPINTTNVEMKDSKSKNLGGPRAKRPPEPASSLSRIFYQVGPVGKTRRNLTIRDQIKAFWVTKNMADEVVNEELQVRTALVEALMAFVYIIVLISIINGTLNHSMYTLRTSLKRQFIDSAFLTYGDRVIRFNEIKSAADVWAYLEKHFVQSLYWEQYYHSTDPQASIHEMDRHVLLENALVGNPRIRVLRVQPNSCRVARPFRRQFNKCFDYYSESKEDKEPLFGGNQPLVWANNEQDIKFSGIFATYGTGGYTIFLKKPLTEALDRIHTMRDVRLISRATRLLLIDFTVFNTNVNLFCLARIAFEYPPTGGVWTSYSFNSVNLLGYNYKYDYFILGVEYTFLILIIYAVLEEIREILFFGLKYVTHMYNIIDFLLLIPQLYCFWFIIEKSTSYYQTIAERLNENKPYVNLLDLAYYQTWYYQAVGVILFGYWIKLLRFLEVNEYLGYILKTIKKAAADIFGFLIMFSLVFLSFAELGFLLFGTNMIMFSSFSKSIVTLVRIICGDFDYEEIDRANRVLGPLFLITYMFFLFFVLLNMFLAILSDAYSEVKNSRLSYNDVTPMEFLARGWYNLFPTFNTKTQARVDNKRARLAVKGIRESLRKANFTFAEINMFLAKYGIDAKREILADDVRKIIRDLQNKGYVPTKVGGQILKRAESDKLAEYQFTENSYGLSWVEYEMLQSRLDQVEIQVETMAERLDSIIGVLQMGVKDEWLDKGNKAEKTKKPEETEEADETT